MLAKRLLHSRKYDTERDGVNLDMERAMISALKIRLKAPHVTRKLELMLADMQKLWTSQALEDCTNLSMCTSLSSMFPRAPNSSGCK